MKKGDKKVYAKCAFIVYNELKCNDVKFLEPMQIIAKCPRCGDSWLFEASAADRRMRCRKCYQLFKIPKLEEVSKAVNVIKHAKSDVFVDDDGKTYG